MADGQTDNTNKPETKKAAVEPSVWPFVLPFLAYMLIASRAPSLTPESIDDAAVTGYLGTVILQVIVTLGLVLFFLKRYLADFPFRIDIWGFVIGIVGVVIWVGLCSLELEKQAFESIGLDEWLPERLGFNPFEQISDPSRRAAFLFFRFSMLALMVPIIEELFLRGFLLRWVENPAWHQVKLSDLGMAAIGWSVIYGVLTHPGEALAAAAWFGLVTIMMIRTGKFWNCVVAHAVTNLLLGLYVIYSGAWQLW